MATQEDKKTETPDALDLERVEATNARALSVDSRESSPPEGDGEGSDAAEDESDDPGSQFGYKRYVYAAYFAGAILVAFVAEKTLTFAWTSLAKWKPHFGEPSDEVVMPAAALVGGLVALYFWRRTRTRELAEDVASELAKVTWPTKKEVANNTMIVIFTTVFATVFFTLMDRFWSFVTNWVYGT